MPTLIPSSIYTTVNDALDVTSSNSTVVVRDGVYLGTDGNGHDAIDINVGSNANTIFVDGYLIADEGHGIEANNTSNHEITIGVSGSITTGVDGIDLGTGTSSIVTNDGSIVAGSNAFYSNNGGSPSPNSFTNNGSVTASSTAIYFGEGG